MKKINTLEDGEWEIEKVETDERYMGNKEYRTEVIIRMLEKTTKKIESEKNEM